MKKKQFNHLAGTEAVETFIQGIENSAFRLSELATKNTVDAMDVLEIAVIQWVKKHSFKPYDEWLLLFYKTLYQVIAEFENKEIPLHRRINPRNEMVCLQDIDPTEKSQRSAATLAMAQFNKALVEELGHLPLPQQQAFLLCEWLGFGSEQIARMLMEPPLIISNRHKSAQAGLQDSLNALLPQNNGFTLNLMDVIRDVLDESVKDISYAQQYQLRQIRNKALKQLYPRPIIQWVVPITILSLSLFVFWSQQLPRQSATTLAFYSTHSQDKPGPQAWQENESMLEDLEFYIWLAEQKPVTDSVDYQSSVSISAGKNKNTASFNRWNNLPSERKTFLLGKFQHFMALSPKWQEKVRFTHKFFQEAEKKEQAQWLEKYTTFNSSNRAG